MSLKPNGSGRILIVDDEKSIRATLRAFLQDEGYAVDVAEDVQSAQQSLSRKNYDVVVTDIILSGVSGVTLLQQVRETSPDIQVIMMTGEPTIETAAESVRAGACDYLAKPVDKPAILHSVAIAIKLKELKDEIRQYRETLEQLVARRTHELSETVDKLKQSQKQLIKQERMNAVGQMASGVAHDFNNALMPIVGFSEMLLSDPSALDDRKDTIHLLEMIHAAGQDAKHIVQRLRHIYKEEASEYEAVELATAVKHVISMTMPKWKEEMNARGLTIEMATELENVPLIKGNMNELREAFTNLILNAIDAMPVGGTITLKLRSKIEIGVMLDVSDTGIGMDKATLDHCLDPFFTTKGGQGTGLGLPMVYGIILRHGGTMEIDSQPAVGTTIRIGFPVLNEADLFEAPSKAEPETLDPLNVLIIDDDARSRDLIARFLKADGHAVEIAESGQKGVTMARREAFDLVITDRAMPLMSGDKAAEEIKKHRPGMPIIMLTGFGDIMKDKADHPPAVTWVMSKPVTNKDLRSIMTRVMKGNRSGNRTTASDPK